MVARASASGPRSPGKPGTSAPSSRARASVARNGAPAGIEKSAILGSPSRGLHRLNQRTLLPPLREGVMRSMTDEGWSREERRLGECHRGSRLASLDPPSSDPTTSGHLPPQGGKERRLNSADAN